MLLNINYHLILFTYFLFYLKNPNLMFDLIQHLELNFLLNINQLYSLLIKI